MSERIEWAFKTPAGQIVGPYTSMTDAVTIGGRNAPLYSRTVTDWERESRYRPVDDNPKDCPTENCSLPLLHGDRPHRTADGAFFYDNPKENNRG